MFHYAGIYGQAYNCIQVFLIYCFEDVVVYCPTSHHGKVIGGTPQGTRPAWAQGIDPATLIFLLFMDDLLDNLHSKVQLFQDDCTIYSEVKSPHDCKLLYEGLGTIYSEVKSPHDCKLLYEGLGTIYSEVKSPHDCKLLYEGLGTLTTW